MRLVLSTKRSYQLRCIPGLADTDGLLLTCNRVPFVSLVLRESLAVIISPSTSAE